MTNSLWRSELVEIPSGDAMEILMILAIPVVILGALVVANWHLSSDRNLIPMLGFAVLIVGSIFGYEFFHLSGGPIPITLDRLLLGALLGAFFVSWIRGLEDLRKINSADVAIGAVIGVATFSTILHDWRFMDNMPASRLLFFYFVPFALYLAVSTARLGKSDLKFISGGMVCLGIYLSLTAIAETRELTALVYPRYIMTASDLEFLGRGRGPFLNPVSNGIFIATCLCAMWMWWPKNSKSGQALCLLATVLMLAGIFCTLTRSVWVGAMATIGLVIWYPASRQTKGAMIICATVIATIALPVVGHKVFSFKRDKVVSQQEMETSAQLRPMFAIVAWEMFQDRPVFGCGFGQYARAKYPYLQDSKYGQPLSKTKYFMQHNVVLAFLVEMGIVGVASLCCMLAIMIRTSWKLWNDNQIDPWARNFGLIMLVVIVNFLINGMFHDVSIVPMQHVLLLFIFGLVNNIVIHRQKFMVGEQLAKQEFAPAKIRPRRVGDGSSISPA